MVHFFIKIIVQRNRNYFFRDFIKSFQEIEISTNKKIFSYSSFTNPLYTNFLQIFTFQTAYFSKAIDVTEFKNTKLNYKST